ncbi:MAG TPA: hypothetical protein VMN78_06045 [Longimicrobiales bacterium]|nr:hypothetical protein [Longimicrobiales bacterium]
MKRSMIYGLAMMAGLAACGTDDGVEGETTLPAADSAPAPTPTRGQRDSAVAASKLPGAGAVRRALETSETASRRAEAMDSVLP